MCTRSRARYMLRIFHISSTGGHIGEGTSRWAEVGSLGPSVKFVTLSGIRFREFVEKSRCTCKFPDIRLEDVKAQVSLTQEVADRQRKVLRRGESDRSVRYYRALLQGVDGGAQLVQVDCLDQGHARDRRRSE